MGPRRVRRLAEAAKILNLVLDRGLYFPELELWCDARLIKPYGYISHGHSDHRARHRQVLATPATAAFLRHIYRRVDVEVLDYGDLLDRGAYTLTLYPAGHCPGSAQALLTIKASGERILYTGDFKLRANRATLPAPIVPCDTLILDATYGHPRYAFPPQDEVEDAVIAFVEAARADGAMPVLLAYSLGKAQEALQLLTQHGYRVGVTDAVYGITKVLAGIEMDFLGDYAPTSRTAAFEVLVAPPGRDLWLAIAAFPRVRTLFLTGWALDRGPAGWRHGGAALPVSDHADFPELVRYAEEARPERVFTIGGSSQLVSHLNTLGFPAWQLDSPQMVLPLG